MNKEEDNAYYNNRGLTKIELNDKEGACLDWAKALQLGHSDAIFSLEQHCE